MFTVMHHVPGVGVAAAFRCGKLPDHQFSKDEIPGIFAEEMARITGIKVSHYETRILWDELADEYCKGRSGLRGFFLDGESLDWAYRPSSHIPGERWRIHISQTSHEISAVLQRIRIFRFGYLTVEDRLVRWGLVLHIGEKIREFKKGYTKRQDEWRHFLTVLDVCEEDIQVMSDFVDKMPRLNPVSDLIPIRVLEVITVFRILFRLSLRTFELAYAESL
jgi:hypothetical protein